MLTALSCEAENYPTEVAALSRKMVQATLEIYKNTWLRRWQGLLPGLGCKWIQMDVRCLKKTHHRQSRHPESDTATTSQIFQIFFSIYQSYYMKYPVISNEKLPIATTNDWRLRGTISDVFCIWHVFVYSLWISCPITIITRPSDLPSTYRKNMIKNHDLGTFSHVYSSLESRYSRSRHHGALRSSELRPTPMKAGWRAGA